ncbi:MAG TPA: chorismate synthase [Vicinamibacterales bacterium]|nr:chorismate synthase [Vicinamibacterales bacterium]
MLRFLTAGESHGRTLVAILDGVPSGLTIDFDHITQDLRRRQGGYGRGQRMAIESDRADFIAGVRRGKSTGAPIALLIANRDWKNWQVTMHVEADAPEGATGANRAPVVRPRPGHADLSGGLKYEHDDLRDVLERASARETAARVAVGAIARQLLRSVGIEVVSHVTGIGDIVVPDDPPIAFTAARAIAADAPLHCADATLEAAMMAAIDRAREAGDTVGGSFEVIAHGVPAGLGSHVQWDRKLDGRLAQAMMSVPAIKAVAIGAGAGAARRHGSQVHDEIVPRPSPRGEDLAIMRPTNRAGGLEGGVTNGEDVRVSAYMKPISTLMKPLGSIDLTTLDHAPAAIERSDVCAVPAAAVVGEAVVCFVLADALLERFGGDSMRQLHAHYRETNQRMRQRLTRKHEGHEGQSG